VRARPQAPQRAEKEHAERDPTAEQRRRPDPEGADASDLDGLGKQETNTPNWSNLDLSSSEPPENWSSFDSRPRISKW
jgi:hypothetical protein